MQKRWNALIKMIKTLYLLAFSCKIPSCHNLEYESPWDSWHSVSLGGLKCLPFLYDTDPVNKHVLENTEKLHSQIPSLTRVKKFLKDKRKYKSTNPNKYTKTKRWLNMSKADNSQKKLRSALFKINWFLKIEGLMLCWGTYWHFQLKSQSQIPLGRFNQYINQSHKHNLSLEKLALHHIGKEESRPLEIHYRIGLPQWHLIFCDSDGFKSLN